MRAHLIDFLAGHGMPTTATGVRREHVEAFMASMVDRLAAATVARHYRSLQQVWKWLEDDGEIPASPMARMSPPAVPEQPVAIFTDDGAGVDWARRALVDVGQFGCGTTGASQGACRLRRVRSRPGRTGCPSGSRRAR